MIVVVVQLKYHHWLMHVLTCMARPKEKQVPMSYFDFMTRDSVRILSSFAVVISFSGVYFWSVFNFALLFLIISMYFSSSFHLSSFWKLYYLPQHYWFNNESVKAPLWIAMSIGFLVIGNQMSSWRCCADLQFFHFRIDIFTDGTCMHCMCVWHTYRVS